METNLGKCDDPRRVDLETFLSGMETRDIRSHNLQGTRAALKPSLVEWKPVPRPELVDRVMNLETFLSGMETDIIDVAVLGPPDP